MIKVVIIDDEINAQIVLKKLFEKYFSNNFFIVDVCNSVTEGVKSINNHTPDLVFLDIQMPGENGFELFKYFKTVNFEVIFTTAYEKFALKAIKCSALDYLLKPIHHLDLANSLKLFETRYHKNSRQQKLTLLLENLNLDDQNSYKIAFPTVDGFELIHSNQILYCKADSNYCLIKKVDEGIVIVTKSLKYVEELMPEKKFKRIHKTYVSNLNYIVRYNKTLKEVELTNGEKLPVSFRKEEEFVKTILHKE
jgi:two-component system LytT family response regulator